MQPGLILLPLMLTLGHSLHYEWPVERWYPDDTLHAQERYDDDGYPNYEKSSDQILVRQRRARRLCGQKFIEHLLILCNSCILPAGSEIAKRSTQELTHQQVVQRLMKRELSIAKKCCAGQCKISELEALCCKNG